MIFSCINYFLDILTFIDAAEVKIKLIQGGKIDWLKLQTTFKMLKLASYGKILLHPQFLLIHSPISKWVSPKTYYASPNMSIYTPPTT